MKINKNLPLIFSIARIDFQPMPNLYFKSVEGQINGLL